MKRIFGVFIFICILSSTFLFSVVEAADYQYDKLNRITKVSYEDGSYVTYTYDLNGNIEKIVKYTPSGSVGEVIVPGGGTPPKGEEDDSNNDDLVKKPNSDTEIKVVSTYLPIVWNRVDAVYEIQNTAVIYHLIMDKLPTKAKEGIRDTMVVIEQKKDVSLKVGAVYSNQIMSLLDHVQ